MSILSILSDPALVTRYGGKAFSDFIKKNEAVLNRAGTQLGKDGKVALAASGDLSRLDTTSLTSLRDLVRVRDELEAIQNAAGIGRKIQLETMRDLTYRMGPDWAPNSDNVANLPAALKNLRNAPTPAPTAAPATQQAARPAAQAPAPAAAPAPIPTTAPTQAAASVSRDAARLKAARATLLDEVDEVIRTGDPDKIQQKLVGLRRHITDKEHQLLDDSGTKFRNYRTPQEVLEDIRAGRPVDRGQFNSAMDTLVDVAKTTRENARQLAHITDIRNKTTDLVTDLDTTLRAGGKVNTDTYIAGLKSLLRDANLLRKTGGADDILKPIEELDRLGILARADGSMTVPAQIIAEIKAGRPITERELETVQLVLKQRFDNTGLGKPASEVAAAAQPASPMMLGAAGGAGNLGRTLSLTADAATRIANLARGAMTEGARGRGALTDMHVWDMGELPGFRTRLTNWVWDNPRSTAMIGAPLLAGATWVGGMYGYQNIRDLTGLGRIETAIANAFLWEEEKIGKVPGYNDVVGGIYNRILRSPNTNQVGTEFYELTRRITGIDLAKEASAMPGKEGAEGTLQVTGADGKPKTVQSFSVAKIDFETPEGIELIRRLIEQSQAATPSGGAEKDGLIERVQNWRNNASGTPVTQLGVTEDSMLAYKIVLSRLINTKEPTTDPAEWKKAWAESTVAKMVQDKTLASAVIKNYFGRDINFDDPLSLNALSENKGTKGSSLFYRDAVISYLVQTGKLDKPETANQPDNLKKYIQGIQEKAADQRREQLDNEAAARYHGTAPAAVNRPTLEQVTAQFNQYANDEVYPELKGKGTLLVNAFKKAQDNPEAFEAELKAQQIPADTIKPLRELAFGR